MSLVKDLKSKPKKGRFFPIRFGDAVKAVKDLKLVQYDESRIVIRLENMNDECKFGYPLLDLVPEEELAIFSLPESIDLNIAKKAAILAITSVSKLKARPQDSIHNSYFCAYLASKNTILLTRVDRTAKLKKYRGSDKLSNAMTVGSNKKEIELETIYI